MHSTLYFLFINVHLRNTANLHTVVQMSDILFHSTFSLLCTVLKMSVSVFSLSYSHLLYTLQLTLCTVAEHFSQGE